jgi:MinD-like ATPase involved in chromosome partitioning or flagellar assembly
MEVVKGGGADRGTVLVTVQGPAQRLDLELPGDRPVGDLLPLLVDLCGGPVEVETEWELGRPGAPAFGAGQTLSAAGVVDGTLVELRDGRRRLADVQPIPISRTSVAKDGLTPRQRTLQQLPPVAPPEERLSAVLGAALNRGPAPTRLPPAEPRLGEIVRPSVLTIQSTPRMMERIRVAYRGTDYLHRLDEAVMAPQLRRCATIAVMSPKGGVGKTTITALLGALFALVRRDRIVAIDTNPDFGSLGRTLAPDHDVFVDDLLQVLDDPALTVTELDNRLGRSAHGLMVLPAPTDPVRVTRLDEAAYVRVVRKLQQMVGVLLLDSGTGLQDSAARAALETADQIVLVSDSEPATASLVAEAAALLKQEGVPLWLVLNRYHSRSRLDVDAFAAVVPDARGMVLVPEERAGARQITAGEFNWLDSPATWKRAIRELAVDLVSAWPALGLAGPVD